jgi:anaerobic selenocysteine-containing dehydrogenase
MPETRKATCMLCEAVCGLSVELDGGAVRAVRGDGDDPFSRGYLCPKATAIADVMSDPDRVRAPQRRIGTRWERVGWDEALEEAAARIAAVQRRHQVLLPIPDVDRTDYMLMLGANPLASNGSLMTAPGIGARLKALRARGGRLVVVDPRRSETAEIADEHVVVRPGGDAALLAGMVHVIVAEKRAALGRLAPFTDGLDALSRIVARFSPERVAPRAGVSADTIRRLAREFSSSKKAVCYARVGACTQEFGGLAAWLVNVLNIVTGNLDREGGAMFTRPAADLVGATAWTGDRGHFGVWRSRVRGLPEFGGELPVATLAEEIETPGEGQIRALVTFAGNPVLSSPNGARLERALSKLEVMVSIDVYQNETTRHADLILPTTFGFERDHYDLVFYALAVRNAAKYVPALVAPPPEVRDDFEVMLDLVTRLRAHGGGRRGRLEGLTLAAVKALGPRRLLDLLLRVGPHRLSLAKLAKHPEGIDLGPLEPALPDRLFTKNRRIALVPEVYVGDLARLEASLDGATSDGLVLIGRRALRSNNSWMHNSARLVKGPVACTLKMHPTDAAARGLVDGARVRARSRVGAVEVPLEVSDEVAPGVVSLPHGWGHAREGTALAVARAHAGASVNDLTDDQRVDALSGAAAFNGVPVVVEAV